MIDQTVYFGETSRDSGEAYLTTIPGKRTIRVFEVLTVGRYKDNDLCLNDPYISGHHCRIEKRHGSFFLRDLKSRNGVKLNGLRISEGELSDGTEISIGSSQLIFHKKKIEEPQLGATLSSKNAKWNEELKRLPSIAESDLPVFLYGESGTGKEVLAHEVHRLSLRKLAPFVSVNCSALSESLVESELFGHVKGSFTGAGVDRKGAFEAARGGTLFLDEIGDLPLTLQPKLLRAIENREIKPVGSDKKIQTNVRIVTATHKNLEQLIERNLFRADLYFRIHVVKVVIPNLRARLEDFDDLIYHFCREAKISFAVNAIHELRKYIWPGNIRELKNFISRAKALYPSGHIGIHEVDALLSRKPRPIEDYLNIVPEDEKLPLIKEVEKEMIKSTLLANNYNQRKTALDLGIPKSTLHDRIKAYRISVKSK